MKSSNYRSGAHYVIIIFCMLLQLWLFPNSPVEAATCPAIPATAASDTVSVQIPAAGTYKIWSRLRTQGDAANSYWLKIDANCEIVVGDLSGMQANIFLWVGFRDGNSSSVVTASLSAGQHVITLIGRESGTGIDNLLFTTDLNCSPAGSTCTGPTVSISPTGSVTTQLGLSIGLHGIGSGGDNTNASSTGNPTPKHPQRVVEATIFDSQNQQVANVTATVAYNTQNGKFIGTVPLPSTIVSGSYTVKIRSEGYLRRAVPGIITITKNQTTQVLPFTLITGDATLDNQLSVLDYNIILDCYSDLQPPKNCSDPRKLQLSDFTDDGKVTEFDYNLFLRELSTQGGQ
jgi:hypothetical protein